MTYVFNFKQHTPAIPAQKLSAEAIAFTKSCYDHLGIKYNPPIESKEEAEDTAEADQSQTKRALSIRAEIDKAIYEANEHNRFVHNVRKQLGLKAAF